MKLVLFVAFLASASYLASAKKLLVVGGLNGLNGGVVGLNGGLVGLNGGLLNPGLVVGGLNPGLLPAGGAFIAQQPFAGMFPAIPPYMLQPPVGPFGLPNIPGQLPQQVPFQPNGNQGMPFFPPVNRQVFLPQQQQAMGGMNPMGNGQQPQGDMPAGPGNRLRRALLSRMQKDSLAQANQIPPTTLNPNADK